MTKTISSMVALTLSALLLLSSSFVNVEAGRVGQTAVVESGANFCFFLPKNRGGNIANAEGSAIAYCTKQLRGAPGAHVFPPGFIQSAHFQANRKRNYVQVTGRIRDQAYSLFKGDGGGQFDDNAPRGAACAKYAYFVNLVEPDKSTYCMRCCEHKEDCNTGRSTRGCEDVIEGTYT